MNITSIITTHLKATPMKVIQMKDTQQKITKMALKYTTLLLITAALSSLVISNNLNASEKHVESKHDEAKHTEDKHEEGHHGEESGHIEISLSDTLAAGIINATASAGQIKNVITVYGRAILTPSGVSQVSARFPGMITKINVNIGDVVNAGETIAQVESSNSLTRYNITAPIAGVITERHANPGEIANQQPLLTLENHQQLWVQYKIFPSQSTAIKKAQKVTVSSDVAQTTSTISHLMPTKNQPFITAIVALNNQQGQWHPGQILSGKVVTSQVDVDVVIDNRAFQEVDGKKVIFVTNQGGYETRELQLGQTDDNFSQVISGLKVGEQYALANSYLLKADLGKAGAAHVH